MILVDWAKVDDYDLIRHQALKRILKNLESSTDKGTSRNKVDLSEKNTSNSTEFKPREYSF